MISALNRSWRAALLAAAVAFVTLPLGAGTARADVFSDAEKCIAGYAKATMDPETIGKVLNFLKNNPSCIGYFAEPEFWAMAGGAAAAKKANKFSGVDACVAAAPGLSELSKFSGYVPAVGDLTSEFKCACAVADAGLETLEKEMKDLAEATQACGGVIGDFIKWGEHVAKALADAEEDLGKITKAGMDTFEDCLMMGGSFADCVSSLGSLGKALIDTAGDALNDAACIGTFGAIGCDDGVDFFSLSPSQQYMFCKWLAAHPEVDVFGEFKKWCVKVNYGDLGCQGVSCAPGSQCGGPQNDKCVPCSGNYLDLPDAATVPATTLDSGLCGCGNGFKPVYKAMPSGPVLTGCACPAPKQVSVPGCKPGDTTCLVNGKMSGKAVCACPSNKVEKTVNGVLQCNDCNLGFKPDAKQQTCIPLCPAGQVPSGGGCTSCPANYKATYFAGLGKCEECPPGTRSPKGSTECLPLDCGSGYQDPNNPHACKYCAPGYVFVPATKKILPGATPEQSSVVVVPGHCEKGQMPAAQPILPKPDIARPVRANCAARGPLFINDPGNPAVCIRCPLGTVPGPARAACIPRGPVVAPQRAQPPQMIRPGIRPLQVVPR